MPALSPRARRALALAGLTGALVTPTTFALAADGPAPAGSPVLSPAALSVPASTADVIAGHLAGHLAETRHDRAVRATLRAARRLADERGERLRSNERALLHRRSVPALKAQERRLRNRLRDLRRTGGAPDVPVPAHLAAIAACESGGDPRAIGGGGAYRGKYQFSYATWAAVGGQGDPAAAPEVEQDRRAAMLYATAGAGQWPVCGR